MLSISAATRREKQSVNSAPEFEVSISTRMGGTPKRTIFPGSRNSATSAWEKPNERTARATFSAFSRSQVRRGPHKAIIVDGVPARQLRVSDVTRVQQLQELFEVG